MAAKKILTADIRQMMDESNMSKAQFAAVTLKTIAKTAAVLGGYIRVQL